MTDSEKELVNLLRIDAEFLRARGYVFSLEPAADAIERLVKERDEARAELGATRQREHERVVALNDEMKAAYVRAEAAEAQVARLREALQTIAEERDAGRHDGLPEPCPAHEDYTMFAIARAALEV